MHISRQCHGQPVGHVCVYFSRDDICLPKIHCLCMVLYQIMSRYHDKEIHPSLFWAMFMWETTFVLNNREDDCHLSHISQIFLYIPETLIFQDVTSVHIEIWNRSRLRIGYIKKKICLRKDEWTRITCILPNIVVLSCKLLCDISRSSLTHWGWLMHICINKLTIIGSDNGLLPGWHLAINETILEFYWNLINKVLLNLKQKACILIHENAFENILYKMVAFLSQHQCVECSNHFIPKCPC